jgi:hypothetical protein
MPGLITTVETEVFPALGHLKLEAIDLTGLMKASRTHFDAIISGTLKVAPKDYIAVAINYSDGKKPASCRLIIDRRGEKCFIRIKIRNFESRHTPLKLDDEKFLNFFKELAHCEHVVAPSFAVGASFRFAYTDDVLLPFTPNPKSEIFVSGVRYGFNPRNASGNLKSVIVELLDDKVHIVVASNPVFALRPELINRNFFNAVVDFVCRAKNGLVKHRSGN